MNFKPRQYQIEAKESTFRSWAEGNKSVVGRLFTGGGKTCIFADVIQASKKRALVLCHRRELIWQARDKIERVTGMKFQVEMGEYKAKNNFADDLFNPKNVGEAGVVASVQTLTAGGDGGGRMTKFMPTDFDLLIGDEFHHFTSPQFQRVLDYFKRNPNLKILGVTATPNRADEESLSQIADDVAFDKDMKYGISEGWLVPIETQAIYIESLNLLNMGKDVRGDLNQGRLAKRMEESKPLFAMAKSIIEIAGNKRGIGFSPSVEHARQMANIFNSYRGGCAASINGKTDKDERRKINSDFANGEIQWIWNCGTHTEGFDDAGVEVIIPKPTKSESLLEQMVGRSTRPHDSIAGKLGDYSNAALRRGMINRSVKPSCLILEYYGNRYDLATTFDLFAGNITEQAVKEAKEFARKSGGRMPVVKSLEEEEKKSEEKKKRMMDEVTLNSKLKVEVKYTSKTFDPFNALGITAAKPRGWDVNKTASDKMRGVLRKMGLNPDDYDYTQTRQLVTAQLERWKKGLCSMKQAQLLKKYGYDSSVTFEVAKKLIDGIAANGWKRDGLPPVVGSSKKSAIPPRSPDATIDAENPF